MTTKKPPQTPDPPPPPPPPPTKQEAHAPFEHTDKMMTKGYVLVISRRWDDQIGANLSRDGAAEYNSTGQCVVDVLNNLESFLSISEVP